MAHVPSRVRKKVEWLLRRAEGALLPEPALAEHGAHLDPPGALASLARLARPARPARPASPVEAGQTGGEVEQAGATPRVEQLRRALGRPEGSAERRAYVEQHGVAGVQRFGSKGGARIYALSVETFPGHVNNVYLVVQEGSTLLFDCGSNMPSSERDLALGFAVVRAAFGEAARFEEIDWCVVSHAHYDHFGGANHLRRQTRARLAVHELDARVLACFEERLVIAAKDCDIFWRRAGVPDDERAILQAMYTSPKSTFRSEEVDRVLRDGELVGDAGGGYRVHHVPGHCPGLVCLQVHDVLLTSDHVLSRITPHQFPQAITPFAGLEHYFRSLSKIRELEGIGFALGGHEDPIWDLRGRIDAIALFHRDRLARVLALCDAPKTIQQVGQDLFGEQEGYSRLLALDEAGAHVEYLHEMGKLRIANLDAVASARDPVIEYVAR